ncbi:hypothetical protein [Solwaraspora sp. WMMD792]|uniref:hypothetical protein n=1 Tax=Solwaraspora sp. WMMD792 TaxID=3016099 RepID=UPI002416935F|nr:hypothetical protein [Solwaraspora sp. WMMD792]MDG4775199.1 hypothetical protein [Solwaraspora sp. WMMD792]
MRRHRTGLLLAVPISLALALAVSSCAGAADGDQVATADGAGPTASAGAGDGDGDGVDGLTEEERQLRFARCMRENGVDMPDPEPGEGGAMQGFGTDSDMEKVEAAIEQCREFLPGGGETGQSDPEQIERVREIAKCMRENGVTDFPDPDVDGRMNLDLSMSPDDPTFQAAMEKCGQGMAPPAGGSR